MIKIDWRKNKKIRKARKIKPQAMLEIAKKERAFRKS